ncbi:hypothetical protein DMW62_17855 [Serratia marcescens]|nr:MULTISPECIES: hypothetical protein [Serratia]EHT9934265.1 hypothetical protein [Serratia marcescens]EIJ6674212.1 hypothetical protein [Serratia marcescens]EMB4114589.1 hypothetical protein [Serratia marcescens]MDI9110498.1 hypothetical protein [Serratia marcescens]MDP8775222.1 hypothetical protein [Serratia marcescens]
MNNNQYEYITEAINVEDMVIISDDFAIGSSYSNKSTPTGLYLFNTVLKTHESINLQDVEIKHDILNYPDATPLPDLNLMSTHGLDYDQHSHKLYVINHGHRESVEIFDVSLLNGKPSLSWVGCIIAPPGAELDAVSSLNDNGIVATNIWNKHDEEKRNKLINNKPGGEILKWSQKEGWRKIEGIDFISAPNGILSSNNGETIYSAIWGGGYILKIKCQDNIATSTKKLQLEFHPDNIKWSKNKDNIVVCGQKMPMKDLLTAIELLPDYEIPFQVDIVDTSLLTKKTIISDKIYNSFCSATGAIEINNEYWLTSFRCKKIAIYKKDDLNNSN